MSVHVSTSSLDDCLCLQSNTDVVDGALWPPKGTSKHVNIHLTLAWSPSRLWLCGTSANCYMSIFDRSRKVFACKHVHSLNWYPKNGSLQRSAWMWPFSLVTDSLVSVHICRCTSFYFLMHRSWRPRGHAHEGVCVWTWMHLCKQTILTLFPRCLTTSTFIFFFPLGLCSKSIYIFFFSPSLHLQFPCPTPHCYFCDCK